MHGTVDIGAFEYGEISSVIVTTLDDIVDSWDGLISLREAIGYAQQGETVTFAPSLYGKTVVLNGRELSIDKNITIDASGVNITIDANKKSRAFNIAAGAKVELVDLKITGGYYYGDTSNDGTGGGAIRNYGTLSMTSCTITGNSTHGWGGGIHNTGILTVANSLITGNAASVSGGGIENIHGGTLTIVNSKISENSAGYGGGGVENANGTLTVTNSLISGNTADYGGGICGSATVTNSTIAGNTANDGNGLVGGGYTLNNTIVVGNSLSISGTILGHNNLTEFIDWSNGSSNNFLYGPDLLLFVDAANGDYRLLPDSQAINRGNNQYAIAAGLNGNSLDLAGNTRIFGTSIDIGAYEFLYEYLVAPVGYNANDLAKVSAAGLTDDQITWTETESEMRLTGVNITGSSFRGTLDLSGCDALEFLNCSNNQLTSLNVSGCTTLTSLDCSNNLLKSLNVSGLTKLEVLWCAGNLLTSLSINNCPKLNWLECYNNQLTFSTLPTRGVVSDYRYDLQSSIDLEPSDQLTVDLSSEFMNGTTKFTWYYTINSSKISTNLYTETNGKFEFTDLEFGEIYCEMTNGAFPGLTLRVTSRIFPDISASELELANFNANDLAKVTAAGLTDNQITWTWSDADDEMRLTRVNVSSSSLHDTLDLSGCTLLFYLDCSGNQLTSLNLSGCSSLLGLDCSGNQLTSLNLAGCKSLYYLDCTGNQLKSLNVSGYTDLLYLSCSENQLTSLNVSGCKKLEYLYCGDNPLTSLNISDCTALQILYCWNNQLTSLDISKLTSLTSLDCTENDLKFSTLFLPGGADNIDIYGKQKDLSIADSFGSTQLFDLSIEHFNGATEYTWFSVMTTQ